jgi:DNA-binding response OmpR family regulator
MNKILIVDGDRQIRQIMAARFRNHGHEIIEAGTGWSAMQLIDNEQITQVILNELLPDMNGFEVLETILNENAGLPVMFILENQNEQNRLRAARLGACEILEKPLHLNRLITAFSVCQAKNTSQKPNFKSDTLATAIGCAAN